MTTRPFVLTLALDDESFATLDGWRRRYYPPGRNVVPAHVSLFHQLPGDQRPAIETALEQLTQRAPFSLLFQDARRFGAVVLVTVEAPELRPLHAKLVKKFRPWLIPQDQQKFRPHVTIVNKVTPAQSLVAHAEIMSTWKRWTGEARGLQLWIYDNGPWIADRFFPFGGHGRFDSP